MAEERPSASIALLEDIAAGRSSGHEKQLARECLSLRAALAQAEQRSLFPADWAAVRTLVAAADFMLHRLILAWYPDDKPEKRGETLRVGIRDMKAALPPVVALLAQAPKETPGA